ncbi:MAG: type I-G CRISPR-associated protein, Cas3-extension family [Bryobacteraceae bacterium]
MIEIELSGPRGDNPLGFLATLGVIAVLEEAGFDCRLRWKLLTPVLSWKPPAGRGRQPGTGRPVDACQMGHRRLTENETYLVRVLDDLLRRKRPDAGSREELEDKRKQKQSASTARKNKEKEIKQRRLPREERRRVEALELEPLRVEWQRAQVAYLECLSRVAVDPVLSLGENLTAKNNEWMEFVGRILQGPLNPGRRRMLSLVASYGVGDPNRPDDIMLSTPWAMLRGAGHQHFLETVQELMIQCTFCHLAKALFGPWIPTDLKLSLRLDPAEDRRYALMAEDPTSSSNPSRSLWGANRLAFEGLVFFPAYPAHPMGLVAWRNRNRDNWLTDCEVRWPLWSEPLSPAAVRSLLRLPDLFEVGREGRRNLQARRVFALFKSQRILNDKYYNLTPGVAIWMAP